jgi:hypothetical protein
MPSVFISPEKILDEPQHPSKDEKQTFLSILKAAGAPVLGMFVLKLDPQYAYKIWRDAETSGIFVRWH